MSHEERDLKDLFPDLFLLSLVRMLLLPLMLKDWKEEGGAHHWNPTLCACYSGLGVGDLE
jgi:hypothetical protein